MVNGEFSHFNHFKRYFTSRLDAWRDPRAKTWSGTPPLQPYKTTIKNLK